jgi:hypothetical protein
VERKNF